MEAQRPGELVGLDCFYVGRSGTKGAFWQYTAIDVASGYAWAELHATPRNPAARHCSALVERIASEFARAGASVATSRGQGTGPGIQLVATREPSHEREDS